MYTITMDTDKFIHIHINISNKNKCKMNKMDFICNCSVSLSHKCAAVGCHKKLPSEDVLNIDHMCNILILYPDTSKPLKRNGIDQIL